MENRGVPTLTEQLLPSIWMFLSRTGLTIFPPIRMPVVLQYKMFVPDFRLTYNTDECPQ